MAGVSALLAFVVAMIFFADARGQESETRIQNLNKTVAELVRAYDDKDLSKITDLFNPEDVKSLGGHEPFVEWVDIGGAELPPIAP